MNNKGATENQLGLILLMFITVLVGVILLQASAQQVGSTTNTDTYTNVSVTGPANGANLTLNGKFVTDLEIYNQTNRTGATNGTAVQILDGNWTLYNNQLVGGVEAAVLRVDDAEFAGHLWNASYTTQPTTYIANSGGRAIAGIIIIFFALAIAVVALVPTVRNKILGVKS